MLRAVLITATLALAPLSASAQFTDGGGSSGGGLSGNVGSGMSGGFSGNVGSSYGGGSSVSDPFSSGSTGQSYGGGYGVSGGVFSAPGYAEPLRPAPYRSALPPEPTTSPFSETRPALGTRY